MSDWEHSLFGCFDNPKACIVSYCCPLCTVIWQILQISEENGESPVLPILGMFCGCSICCVLKLRMDIRKKYSIEGSCPIDCLSLWCCGPCAICQQSQQLRLCDGE